MKRRKGVGNTANSLQAGHCHGCGKRYYPKKKAAEVAARIRREMKEVVHHYKCPHGNGYHVGHPNRYEDWQSLKPRTPGY